MKGMPLSAAGVALGSVLPGTLATAANMLASDRVRCGLCARGVAGGDTSGTVLASLLVLLLCFDVSSLPLAASSALRVGNDAAGVGVAASLAATAWDASSRSCEPSCGCGLCVSLGGSEAAGGEGLPFQPLCSHAPSHVSPPPPWPCLPPCPLTPPVLVGSVDDCTQKPFLPAPTPTLGAPAAPGVLPDPLVDPIPCPDADTDPLTVCVSDPKPDPLVPPPLAPTACAVPLLYPLAWLVDGGCSVVSCLAEVSVAEAVVVSVVVWTDVGAGLVALLVLPVAAAWSCDGPGLALVLSGLVAAVVSVAAMADLAV